MEKVLRWFILFGAASFGIVVFANLVVIPVINLAIIPGINAVNKKKQLNNIRKTALKTLKEGDMIQVNDSDGKFLYYLRKVNGKLVEIEDQSFVN